MIALSSTAELLLRIAATSLPITIDADTIEWRKAHNQLKQVGFLKIDDGEWYASEEGIKWLNEVHVLYRHTAPGDGHLEEEEPGIVSFYRNRDNAESEAAFRNQHDGPGYKNVQVITLFRKD